MVGHQEAQIIATEGCPLLCDPQNVCPAVRPSMPACHVPLIWGVWTGQGGLKLQGSTFLNELSRLAKKLDLEDTATWPNQKSPPVTLCHAPVTLPGRALCGLGFAYFASFSVRGATMSKNLWEPAVACRPSGVLLVRFLYVATHNK